MKRRFARLLVAVGLLIGALGVASPAMALDAATVQSYCTSIQQAANTAQQRYLALHTPTTSPEAVFDKAVNACVQMITNYNGFHFSIPSIGDIEGMLAQQAAQLLQQFCQAAENTFKQAVADAATQIQNEVVPQGSVPGLNFNMNPLNSNVGVSVNSGAVGGAMSNAASPLFNSVTGFPSSIR